MQITCHTVLFGVIVVMSVLALGAAVQCYECNVWKAGYGNKCDQPRVRDECTVCMKTDTVVKIGYYKNTPRTSREVSRICAKSNTLHFSNECMTYDTADGTSTRCYCTTDLCNSGTKLNTITALVLMAVLPVFRMIFL